MRTLETTVGRILAVLALVLVVAGVDAIVVVGPASGAPATPTTPTTTTAPACDDVLIPGSSWLDGQGVDVRSNGPNTGGTSCRPYTENLNQNPPQWGSGWQCTELVNRLYMTRGWITKTWAGNAYQLYDNAPANLAKEPQGSITHLAAGDVVVFGTNYTPLGHTGVVGTTDGSTGQLYSQNAPSPAALTLTGGTISFPNFASADKVIGVVHRPLRTTRLAGADRIATAVSASASYFAAVGQGGQQAGAVVLAQSDAFSDALAGTALAVAHKAPILLTTADALDQRTLVEIKRVLAPGGTVHLLGGTSSLGTAVESALTTAGFAVIRYGGTDRYDTAVKIAQALGSLTKVLLVTGATFPDGLAAGAAAAHVGGAVLLTDGSTMAPTTAAYLTANPGAVPTAIGGAAAAAAPSAAKIVGPDRYATALAVAQAYFPGTVANAGLASGQTFPDALSGGALIGNIGGPLLLTPAASVPAAVGTYLRDVVSTRIYIFGGNASVSTTLDGTL